MKRQDCCTTDAMAIIVSVALVRHTARVMSTSVMMSWPAAHATVGPYHTTHHHQIVLEMGQGT